MQSVFTDKGKKPGDADLKKALGKHYALWQDIAEFVKQSFPEVKEEWNYSGEKYGWGFRLKDKKRVIVYLLPREGFFKVAFVFGQKASEVVFSASISETIKDELKAAKAYAEGRGIRLEVKNKSQLADIQKLISIKLAH